MADKYDVVIVGAGPGGCSAAYYLASRGYDVVLLEKARAPGQKNVTGGVLYGSFIKGYGLVDLIPDFEKEAPLERRVARYKLAILSSARQINDKLEYKVFEITEGSLLDGFVHGSIDRGHDYTILKSPFDRWFALKVEEAGGILLTETAAEDLIIEEDRIVGVHTNRGEIYADLVIDASGVTSKLVIKAGLRSSLTPNEVYHGVKHVYELGEEEINERFGVSSNEGVAISLMGDFLHGMIGGGFIYTNRNTLSVGIVVEMSSMLKSLTRNMDKIGKPLDVLEEMESHPYVSRLIEGAKLVEYSAHNIPKGYLTLLKKPYRSGFLVVGDALGVFVKIGALIDGIRRAIASGIMAAETYVYAKSKGDFSERTLSLYSQLLRPLYRDISRYKRNSMLSESRLVYGLGYKLLVGIFGKRQESHGKLARDQRDAIQRIQERTGLLSYLEDEEYSHIRVNYSKANRDKSKLWVPACPVNCYTLVVPGKGVFASYKDLYKHNLSMISRSSSGISQENIVRDAIRETIKDIERGEIRFDHVPCISCGTCWVIGPPDVIDFNPERDGHGVKFKYG